jgi:hypothetical protein
MGTAEPYGLSVGHMHTTATTGWYWWSCRTRHTLGGPVDARKVFQSCGYTPLSQITGCEFQVPQNLRRLINVYAITFIP